jgi:hypothetical protein
MKKIMSFLIIVIFILSGIVTSAIKNDKTNLEINKEEIYIINNEGEYTHTVFLEIANTQFCGGCDFWNFDVYDLYSAGKYNFEYVNMIVYGPDGWDDILNLDAFNWNILYNITKYPTSILDGDYKRLMYQPYSLPSNIDECGIREVINIEANLTLDWLGNATIIINVSIENKEDIPYNGYIRVAITEITSRYLTVNNSNFNFGFLDYAFNKEIFISERGVYTDSVKWNGNEHKDNHGNNFGNIIPGNIQVVMGVYNSQNNFADETVKAFSDNPPSSPKISGPSIGRKGEEYDFTVVSEDTGDNPLLYYIDWGDETYNNWFGPFESGENITVSHNWSQKGKYIIRARAKTINGLMGPWSEIRINIPKRRNIIRNLFFHYFQGYHLLGIFLKIIDLK